VASQAAMNWLPPIQAVFETRTIPLLDGMAILAVGVLLLLAVETERQLRRKFKAGRRDDTPPSGEQEAIR